MQFGIFDQNDRGPSPLAEQYENRLKLIDFYDQVGFRTYHMSEHHSTPLNLTPSPSVFLAAAAQRTRRLRLGALVYILPAHHPLRLAEEICMLDHLSRGRLEVGVGRGASPHELQYFGIDPQTAPAMYVEAYTVIRRALTQKQVNFSGKYYNFENEITDRYRAEWAAAGNSPDAIPLLGINRFVIAADTDREAMELGRRAWPAFYASFMKLWKKHGTQPRYARIPEDFETMVGNGGALAGSPGTIRDQVRDMAGAAGASYFIAQFSFGDLSHQEVLHSAGIFAREVLPASQEHVARAV